jgi:hypothetical protein
MFAKIIHPGKTATVKSLLTRARNKVTAQRHLFSEDIPGVAKGHLKGGGRNDFFD